MTVKRIKRIDLDVLERLILVLYENVEEKKTNIARNSKMSYDKCVLYLDVLEMMGFVKKNDNGKNVFYSLTSIGINFFQKITDVKSQKKDNMIFTV
ncbi:MAG: winged helix-turn-helix domain-containing protein [Candidatus Nitrosopumilus sp. bin_68KS]